MNMDKAYRYDGSFAGFLTCVWEAFRQKKEPLSILPESAPASLFPEQWIDTDQEKARKVYTALRKQISSEAQQQVSLGFLSCCPEKELLLLRFIRMGMSQGSTVLQFLADPTVHALLKATKHLQNEAHLLTGFIRFSDYGNILVSIIEPKNHVLPVLAPHFSDRFSGERFLIWDKTHQEALLYTPFHYQIVPIEVFTPPTPDKAEIFYRSLWKRFYETISIEGRKNLRCQRTHMPLRYRKNMTEHQSLTPQEADFSQDLTLSSKPPIMNSGLPEEMISYPCF